MQAVSIGTALWLCVGSAFAQDAAPQLKFEVASIKPGGKDSGPTTPCRFMFMRQPGGGLRVADRFQLVIRRETKEQQVYALIAAKGGPKLQESKQAKGMMRMGRGMLSAQGVAPGMLASTLSQQLGRPVIDKTGLTGKYDIDLKWTPDPGQGLSGPFSPPPPDSNGPSLFTALNEQLGLRLESEKGPAEVLVIDRVEKPSEN